jgi:hypothetical protein
MSNRGAGTGGTYVVRAVRAKAILGILAQVKRKAYQ